MSTQTNKRWIVIEGDGETLERQRKMMQIRDSTIYCDEGKDIGGDGSAPTPMEFFLSSIIFWEMTQIGRYAHMMKIGFNKVRAHIVGHFSVSGSVLNNTIAGNCEKIEIDYQIESEDDPARVAALLTNARNGCFIRQAVSGGVLIEDTLSLNGEAFDFYSYPPLAE